MRFTMRKLFVAGTLGIWVLAVPQVVWAQDGGLLDGPEQEAMTDTLQYAMENNSTNQSSDWINPDTGRAGGVVPVRTFEGAQGQPCREFVTTIIIGGREEQGYGTACRQADGDWQIVADNIQSPPVAAPAAPREARAYPPPAQYYAYPDGFYGPSRIFLSFSFVHRSGHRHSGLYFLDGVEFRHRYPLAIHERIFVGPRVYDHYPWRDGWDHRGRDDHRDSDDRRGRARYEDGDDHRRRDDDRGGDDRRGRDDHRGRGRGSDDR